MNSSIRSDSQAKPLVIVKKELLKILKNDYRSKKLDLNIYYEDVVPMTPNYPYVIFFIDSWDAVRQIGYGEHSDLGIDLFIGIEYTVDEDELNENEDLENILSDLKGILEDNETLNGNAIDFKFTEIKPSRSVPIKNSLRRRFGTIKGIYRIEY